VGIFSDSVFETPQKKENINSISENVPFNDLITENFAQNSVGIIIEPVLYTNYNMCARDAVIAAINNRGPITFRDFMEIALYHPEYGYYTSPGDKIGQNGDFYTSPFVTSSFGQMIGKQILEMWELLDVSEFTLVEYGAGTGLLCRDIHDYLQPHIQPGYKLNYIIIEKSLAMREKQKTIVPSSVQWVEGIQDMEAFTGCVLSNEVIDNFPVHQVSMQDQLMEIYIDYNTDLVETLQPACSDLKEYFEQLGISLPKGSRAEINLDALQWLKDIGAVLQKGFVLTIDYGYPAANLYQRNQGTLVCYHKHQVNYSPYSNIGSQDITTHVNFSALKHWGMKNGLQYSGYTSQTYFLLGMGLTNECRQNKVNAAASMLRTFLVEMGSRLKVLIQHKGIRLQPLSGLKFSLGAL
jgi:SAM-dependent MidA family methyltransferase